MKKVLQKKPIVSIIMGSESDYPIMKEAEEALKIFKTSYECKILSAHRTPDEMSRFAKTAHTRGIQVIIAGAGGAAHLPGMVAALSPLPVVGVPVPIGALQGQDALLSIVQMPKGVPVATVAIGNAFNAGILAAQIIASGSKNKKLLREIQLYKSSLRKKVKAMSLKK